jgi:hypothetical protein
MFMGKVNSKEFVMRGIHHKLLAVYFALVLIELSGEMIDFLLTNPPVMPHCLVHTFYKAINAVTLR